MAFDPREFLRVAEALVTDPDADEADYRSAAGRAYYSAYGFLRERVCRAHGRPPHQIFGSRGRHTDLASALAKVHPLKLIALRMSPLFDLRVTADYRYRAPHTFTVTEALTAVDYADEILSEAAAAAESDFQRVVL